MTKQIAQNEVVVDTLMEDTMKLDNTSKKIRYLVSLGKKDGEIEKLFQKWGVTTKDGNPIRYQHIRNTRMMKLASNG